MARKKIIVQEVVSPFLKLLKDPNRFQKLEDGWVRDKLCGIEWGPTAEKSMTFKEAQEHCAKFGGRLPELNELHSLVDYTKESPATNKDLFPDTQSSWYWSGTYTAWSKSSAWCVYFVYGFVYDGLKDYANYVRPVRASQ